MLRWLLRFLISAARGDGSPRGYLAETLRLYRRSDTHWDFVWAFEYAGVFYVDHGRVGEEATQTAFQASDWHALEAALDRFRAEGFAEAEDGQMAVLEIVAPVASDFANADELALRNRVADDIDNLFGPTGEGFWVGSGSGAGTMEVAFAVIDYDLSRGRVANLLNRDHPAHGFEVRRG